MCSFTIAVLYIDVQNCIVSQLLFTTDKYIHNTKRFVVVLNSEYLVNQSTHYYIYVKWNQSAEWPVFSTVFFLSLPYTSNVNNKCSTETSSVLRKITVPMQGRRRCRKIWKKKNPLKVINFICARVCLCGFNEWIHVHKK